MLHHMKCPSYNLFFETLSNKTRISIIYALLNSPATVTQICKRTNQEQSKVSHNLKVLSDCHFVDSKKKGKERIYSINKDTIIPILKLISKHVEKYCKCGCMKK